jgi:hypothetical protein
MGLSVVSLRYVDMDLRYPSSRPRRSSHDTLQEVVFLEFSRRIRSPELIRVQLSEPSPLLLRSHTIDSRARHSCIAQCNYDRGIRM